MRVLIVNTSENVGGAAVAANRLMDALNNNGACPTWASMLPIYCSFTILAHGCGFVVGKAKATREM